MRSRCADSCVEGFVGFLNLGYTTELYATGFNAAHCTYQRFVAELKLTTIDRGRHLSLCLLEFESAPVYATDMSPFMINNLPIT